MNDGDPIVNEVLEEAQQYDSVRLSQIMPAIRRCRADWAVGQVIDTTINPMARIEFMDYLQDTWGIALDTKEVAGEQFYVPQYYIVNEKKFTMFLLRWS